MQITGTPGLYGLENHRISNLRNVYWNCSAAKLVEQVVRNGEGQLSASGAVVVKTGQFTGRAPNDKFIVQRNDGNKFPIHWCSVNQPISSEKFDLLYQKVTSYLQNRDVYVQDLIAGAHPFFAMPIRIITEYAWHSLFARNLFICPEIEIAASQTPQFTVIACPGLLANPETDGTNSSTFIVLDFEKRVVLIGGTAYAGEIKKSIFTVMNYLLPQRDVLSMHCSANVGAKGDVALFFGLSGTGKTTLSSDPERKLIGDDEHGWSEDSIFNFEGGCYAKTIHLKKEFEPIIWDATQRFGSVLENVVLDENLRTPDFDNGSLTENTRSAYPLEYVPNRIEAGYAGIPETIFFLTADAFGVMPPISRLTAEQAMYYFLSGYTAKLAGTEKGLGTEPQATFSTCFGAPFLPLNPGVYSHLLGQKVQKHNVNVWLINTGWTGGPYGVGKRIHLPYTRAMIRAAINHGLDQVEYQTDPIFGLSIPTTCPDVPAEILNPVNTWQNRAAYQEKAAVLAEKFKANFARFEKDVSAEVLQAGPR